MKYFKATGVLFVIVLGYCLQIPVFAMQETTLLIQNPDARSHISLNGPWNVIVDPYENGFYNHRYEEYDNGYFRTRETGVISREIT